MADVESANVVGYSDADFNGETMCAIGTPFFTVGSGAATFKLGDLAAPGFDAGSDVLATIDPDTADFVESFLYLDPAVYGATLGGWWDETTSEQLDDTEFDAGQGFMGSFGACEVVVRGAGEVAMEPTSFNYEGQTMVMVPNPLPRTVKLSEISAPGFDPGSDVLANIDPDTADFVETYVYLDPVVYGDTLGGWWDESTTESMGDVDIKPGKGLMGSFGACGVSIVFPSAIVTAE